MTPVSKYIFGLSMIVVVSSAWSGCKPRAYNQSKTKDLLGGSDAVVTICTMVSPPFKEASTDAKASVRVACQGQCNGADYRNRKFFLSNEEKIEGFEFEAKFTSGKLLRGLYVFGPTNGVLSSLKTIALDNEDIQKALASYAINPADISELSIPADGKLLLTTGTKASLSNAGLFDGGTLDCGGQAIDGAVDRKQFQEQNVTDVKNATALP